jgi:hypothetical protein
MTKTATRGDALQPVGVKLAAATSQAGGRAPGDVV